MQDQLSKSKFGPITLVQSLRGVHFMVDTRAECTEQQWDAALAKAYSLGYELDAYADTREVGVWEVFDLVIVDQIA